MRINAGAMTALIASVACSLSSPSAPAAEAAATPSEAEQIDEVLVRGTRLFELRAAIVVAEDKFYARYNELNTNDDFDIHCNRMRRTGTKFESRRCAPRLLDKVLASDGRETLEAMQDGRQKRGEDPHVILARHSAEYTANMLQILRQDRELQALVRERDRAQERYDREHKKRLKGRLILTDWADEG